MFVVDNLVSWLIGRLADAGYQKLSTWLHGSDQARALKGAVAAAVQATVDELGPSDGDEANRVAEQINKAFRRRDPVPLPTGQPTLLEALQAGIAEKLAVADDAGQAAVSLPGVPVSEVAAKLTGHLVREIQMRGSRGGPLADLADQLNHDVTHLQGQRIEGMLARVLEWLGDGLALPSSAVGPVGLPLAEVADPFALEVHHPVEPDVPRPGLPVLPEYVPREHDAALAEVVTAAAAGASGIAVLVGGSSTGKTRACWQALELLRGLEPGWLLWHPIDSQAALDQLPGVGPRTVVWLNEAQRYLATADGTGERVAAGLRDLLRDQARGPIVVLATLWQDFWDELTVRPPERADLHAQARELLDGHDIPVPPAFTGEQLRDLPRAGDPRLAQAAAGSRDGQVIQYLAGAPELLDRYHNAPPAARALIDAAMDARRLHMGPALPRAFLEAAAPGYLTDTEWDLLPGDWLKQGLDYANRAAKGVRGPLTPRRPRPSAGVPASPGGGQAWQLADYLDQHGRRVRREVILPAHFWAAAASHADPADLVTLARAAEARGLYRDAARLYKQASAHNYPDAGVDLVRLMHTLHPGDQRPANWVAAHASLDDPGGVAGLLKALHEDGAAGQVSALLARDPAAHVSLDDPGGVVRLLDALREAGATGQVTALAGRAAAHASLDPKAVTDLLGALLRAGAAGPVATLLARDPAAHASLDNPSDVAWLLEALREAGATRQVTALAGRAAAHVSLDNPSDVADLLIALDVAEAAGPVATLLARDPSAHASLDNANDVAGLLNVLHEAGAADQAAALASRAVAHASLDSPGGVPRLLEELDEAGAADQAAALASRAAAHVSLDNPLTVAVLLRALHAAGAADQVAALASRAAAHASLDDPGGVARLLKELHAAGAADQVALLAGHAAAHASLDSPGGVAGLLKALHAVGAAGQVSALLARDPAAHASLDNPGGVAWLLRALDEAGAAGQVTVLLDRDPAAHASLDDPGGVARLLGALREAGAVRQVTALASRAGAHTSFDSPFGAGGVPELLRALNEAGAQAQATELFERLLAAGWFSLTRGAKQFLFGREADGRPATPWAWTDLG